MADSLASLIRKRGQIKARLTTFRDFVHNLQSTVLDQTTEARALSESQALQLESRIQVIEGMLSQYESVHGEILALETDENIDKRYSEYCEFENTYFDILAEAKQLAKTNARQPQGNKNKSNQSSVSSNQSVRSYLSSPARSIQSRIQVNQNQNQNQIELPNATSLATNITQTSLVKLPVLQMKTYNGEPEQFLSFFEGFKSLVHKNNQLDDVSRFLYLKSVLGPEPSKVIESLDVIAPNYQIALQLLERRYRNNKLLIHSHIKGLIEFPKISKESAVSLRQISDSYQAHMRALSSLGEPVQQWSSIISFLISDKLDYNSKRELEILISKDDNSPDVSILIDFLENRAKLLEKLDKPISKVPTYHKSKFTSHSYIASSRENNCILCGSPHKLYACKKFLMLSVSQRIDVVREHKICRNCFQSGHYASNCTRGHCKKCSAFHSTLLHTDSSAESRTANSSQTSTTEVTEKPSTSLTSAIHLPDDSFEILPTAIIVVYDSKGMGHKCTALLDSASMRSYMTTALCSKLKLETTRVNIPVTGINQTRAKITDMTQCKIQSMHSEFSATLPFLLLQNITDRLPSSSFNVKSLNIPSEIRLANPNFQRETKIDVLLGIDIFWQLLSVQQDLLNQYPYLVNTQLGYVISGVLSSISSDDRPSICNLSILNLSHQMSLFWEIENVSMPKPLSPEEQQCETHFIQTTTRDESGRFTVFMPLSCSAEVLGESRQNALRQFLSLEKRLRSNHKLKNLYVDFMTEYKDLGHMKRVDQSTSSELYDYFIPHHGVYKADSLTTKLRVVFNSSCPTSNGISLNDIQLNGPVLQDDLFSILLRFRRFKYVITGDCSKMYRSILIDASQRCLQKIFWRSDPSLPLEIYELCTVTYGEKSSSFLAIRCLFELANHCEKTHPKVSKIIKRDMYCDDLLTSCMDKDEASYVCRTIFKILQGGGFTLRKWNSNHPEILESVQTQGISNNILEFGPSENSKTLGLLYNSYTDTFLYSISKCGSSQGPLTKRKVLSFISTIFDPLGLLAPCTIKAKIFMQQLWLTQSGWDETLPSDLHIQWLAYSEDLPTLNSFRIPRQVICDFPQLLEIHAFSDSSQMAYGTCIYLRSVSNQNHITVRLLCSKTKVAPLKTVTIPKLELCAVLMMVQLTSRVKIILDIPITHTTYWTDSQIAISWVKTQPHLLETFVANRVSQIQSICAGINLNYIPTKENPADALTRGVSPQKLPELELWWNGPNFLAQPSTEWPNFQSHRSDGLIGDSSHHQKTSLVSVQPFKSFFPFERYSSLRKMQRIMAYCIRFIKNCRASSRKPSASSLTNEELFHSLNTLAKLSQRESFFDEIKIITSGKCLRKGNKLLPLTPFLDSPDGILRASGRLLNSQFDYSKKHPIIVFCKHNFTKLLFKEEHTRLFHAGPKQTLSVIREHFWPIGGQNLAKQTVRNCIICFRARPRNLQNLLGHLPLDRVKPQPPFTVVGTDYCGPFMIKDRKGRGSKVSKCYVCLFVCFSTKAVHLEPVTDLSSESFILCLRRFASRRGMPSKFYSDNGRTYCGAKSELDALGKFLLENKDKLEESFANEHFNWIFLPPYSPSIGGLWEAGVKSSKHHLKRVMGNATLTYEHFYSILVQIEGILNSRPLTPLSNHADDYLPLTPSHFLIGRVITTVPDPTLQHIPEHKVSLYQRLQQITQNFWSRWSKEYISELQCRTKWKTHNQNAEVGSLVLIKDDNLPPTKWRLGRIVQVHRGPDNLVRVVSISTSSGVTKRAISKICPLPVETVPSVQDACGAL